MRSIHPISRRGLLQAPLAIAAGAAPAAGQSRTGGPASSHDTQAEPRDASTGLPAPSALLADAVAAHHAARAKLLDLCARTDEVAIGRAPAAHETRLLDRASRIESVRLLALCGHPCRTDADRHAKARYLLGLLAHTDMSRECTLALLASMQGTDAELLQRARTTIDTVELSR